MTYFCLFIIIVSLIMGCAHSDSNDVAQLRKELTDEYSKHEADLIVKYFSNYKLHYDNLEYRDIMDIKDYMNHSRQLGRHLISFVSKKTIKNSGGYYVCVFEDRHSQKRFVETIIASF